MNSILYGNFRIEILTDVGGKLERISLQKAASQPAARQPTTPADGEAALLLDREDELRRIRLAVDAGDPIELVGPCGFGKTGLLRRLAGAVGGQDAARPWIYLRLGRERLDDTLQRLVDASYTSQQPFKATPEQRTQLLGQVSSVVLLDDLTLGPGDVRQLVASLPGCGLVLASTQPLLGRHGTSVTLAGLTDRAAADLIAGDLGRPLTAAEEGAVHDLAEAVQGQPLHLHQAAALAREDGRSLADLARRAARDPQVLDRLSVDALAEQERRVLAVLALAGGALLPGELIAAVGDVATLGDSLGLLRRRGLVEQHEDRFGLPICHVTAYRELLLKYLQLGGALGTLSDWLATRDPSGQAARSAIDGAVNALGFAAEHAQWPEVVRLVRVLEPALTLAGRWQASREALEHGLAAARELGDQGAEALFSHQLGTLELSLDHLDQARAHLEHAVQLRARLGDHAGAAVSSHNLGLLVPTAPVADPAEPRSRGQAIAERWRAIVGRWPVIASRAAVVALTFLLGVLFLPRGTTSEKSLPATTQASTTTAGGTTTNTTAGATTTAGEVTVPPSGVPDTVPPVLKLPSDLTREATSRNGARVRFAASATDEVDGLVPVTCTPASGSTFPLGTVPVACSAVDRAGFAAIGSFTVTVEDFTPPRLELPSSVTEEATSKDGAQVRFAASATDQIDGSAAVTCTPGSGSTFPLGATTVTCSAVDAAGLAANGDFTVNVNDTRAPAFTLPGDLSVQATTAEGAEVAYQASASDSVDGAMGPTCAPPSGQLFRVGTTKVRCSATDRAGNTATGGFAVTVTKPGQSAPDHAPPVLKLPKDVTVEATSSAGAAATYTASATDLVDGTVPVSCNHPSGSTFPFGTTTVTCSASDRAGNKASGSFKVTVKDRTRPTLTPPKDMTVEATSADGAAVAYTISASDQVDGPVPVTCSPASGSTFPLKTTPVTCSAADKAGNQATGGFTITVEDHTPPRLVLSDVLVEATSGRGAQVRSYPGSAVDLVDGPVRVSCPPGPPRQFRLGTTPVTCSATDKAGNTATGSFNVTVHDTTEPTLVLPRDRTVEATSRRGAQVFYAASATDLVDGTVAVRCSHRSGDTFPLDATTVTCTATDKAGNTATGGFTITVRDRTKPSLTLPTTIRKTTSSREGLRVDYPASASDLVDGRVPVTCTPPSGSTFRVGSTRVRCFATDRAGNTATGRFRVVIKLVELRINQGSGTPQRAR
jgi:hypothetical protein